MVIKFYSPFSFLPHLGWGGGGGALASASVRQVFFPFSRCPGSSPPQYFHRRKRFPSGAPANSTCFSLRHVKIVFASSLPPTPCLTLMKNMAFLEVDAASFVVIGSKPGSRVSILLWAGTRDS